MDARPPRALKLLSSAAESPPCHSALSRQPSSPSGQPARGAAALHLSYNTVAAPGKQAEPEAAAPAPLQAASQEHALMSHEDSQQHTPGAAWQTARGTQHAPEDKQKDSKPRNQQIYKLTQGPARHHRIPTARPSKPLPLRNNLAPQKPQRLRSPGPTRKL
eukprot:CAMPEP_0184287762 /NCGR_PEP_ID=MMETSP1049-20130417/133_1 /TAXON_ID=77928 /ORGANISM="Proteomonas sulcata, Strain CCMP704" /LENGTH=160 /DNA_ID=CAMNT_0026593813 /DNA_START=603 /DNA_END=1086 /DNA_ORIENTATION=+